MDSEKKLTDYCGYRGSPLACRTDDVDGDLSQHVKTKLSIWSVKAGKDAKTHIDKSNHSKEEGRLPFMLRRCHHLPDEMASTSDLPLSLKDVDSELLAIEKELHSKRDTILKMAVWCDDSGSRYVFHDDLAAKMPEIYVTAKSLLDKVKTMFAATGSEFSEKGVGWNSVKKDIQYLEFEKRIPVLTKGGVRKHLENYYWYALSRLESLFIYKNLIFGANISFTRTYVWEVLCSDTQLFEWVLENLEYLQMLCDFTSLMPVEQREARDSGKDRCV